MKKTVLRFQDERTNMIMKLEQYDKTEDKNPGLLIFMPSHNYHHVSKRLSVAESSIEIRNIHKARSNEENRCWALYSPVCI